MIVKIDTVVFFNLWKDKEKTLSRPLTLSEACEITDLAPETIRGIKEGKTLRFDAPVLAKLCSLLDVPPGPIPFIVFSEDE
jgi:DNA-binding Xre family transcriptional regulator